MRSLRSRGVVGGAAALVAAAVAAPTVLFGDREGSASGGSRPGDPLGLVGLPVGAAPAQGVLVDEELRRGSERIPFELGAGVEVGAFVALDEGYLLTTTPDGMGEVQAYALRTDGTVAGRWRAEVDGPDAGPVVSSDGALGAVIADGKALVVQGADDPVARLAVPVSEHPLPLTVVSVSGTDCSGADADCVVLVNSMEPIGDGGPPGSTWIARPGLPPVAADRGIPDVSAVAENGFTAGTTEIIEDGDGSCAGVADASGSVLWTTCRDRLIAFSPDSALVLAGTSTSAGSGDHELTVLDARTGAERLRLRTAPETGIFEMVWEGDDHLLAVVSDWSEDGWTGEHVDNRWAVLRIGVDGSREYAVQPMPGEVGDHDGPLDLPQAAW